jgi:exonuclease VII large subunit
VASKTSAAKLEANARYREKNREKLRAMYRRRYAEHSEELRGKKRKYKEENREKVLASVRKSCKKFRDRIRQAVIALFGGKCARCGFSDWRALQVDHINGGGTKERKSLQNNQALYKAMLAADPADINSKYQLLCANCNQIKRYEEGEHRRRVL